MIAYDRLIDDFLNLIVQDDRGNQANSLAVS